MTMSFEIPADVQAEVRDIPGLDMRVAMYLRHEAQLEAVRRQRHSAKARGIAERAVAQAGREQAEGFDWDASFATLKQQEQAISDKL